MRPSDIFEICLERYRECKLMAVKLGAINPAASAKQVTQRAPGVPKIMAFVIDFELAGKESLLKPNPWDRRDALASQRTREDMAMFFQLHIVQAQEMSDVLETLRIPEGTFKWWRYTVVPRIVGRELDERGLWPPGAYFTDPIDVNELLREANLLRE